MSSSCFYAFSLGSSTSANVKVCLSSTGGNTTDATGSTAFATSADLEILRGVTDIMWSSGILVFWMQAGFAMLEAGSVRKKNIQNILFKNLMDASIGAICFWLLGYSFAFGTEKYITEDTNDNRFIGSGNWALQNFDGDTMYHSWFFQWTFAGAAATIVSGSVAERCRLEGYFVYTIVLTTFIYPIVVHWAWSKTGWMSPFYKDSNGDPYLSKNGFLDFAGSGVVHTTGGFAGLIGAIAIGQRREFRDPLLRKQLKGHSVLLCSLGVSILWMGWYGFNCGSTLGAGAGGGSYINLAAKVAVTTTISAAMGAITTMLYSICIEGFFNLTVCLNGVLAGLVSITAGCAVVEPWAAMTIGIIGGFVYLSASALLKKCQIDDPLDAFPIHGGCGTFGVLAVGIFATRSNIKRAYGFDNDAMTSGNQFRNQLIGVLAIISWSCGTSSLVFFPLKWAGLLRVTESDEERGLDASEHGVQELNEINGEPLNPKKLEAIVPVNTKPFAAMETKARKEGDIDDIRPGKPQGTTE